MGEDKPLTQGDVAKEPSDWSREGRYLIYESSNDVWALPLFGDRKPLRVTQTPFTEAEPQISPDSRKANTTFPLTAAS